MKKALAILFAVIMVVFVCTACGSKTPSGTYVVKTVGGKAPMDYLVESSGMDKETVVSMLGMYGITEDDVKNDFMTMKFEKDGKVTVSGAMMKMSGEDEAMEGTWKLDGSKLTITVDDEPAEFTFKGGKITGDISGEGSAEVVFVKK